MKVAIIGAGINGLYLAQKLAGKGHKVVVFEKKNQIGKEACSGLFSERILDFVPQSKSLVQNRITSVLIHFPRKTVSAKFSKSFLVMSHAELDRLAAREAQKAGAEIVLGNSVDSLPQDFDRIIGCDGANSVVRKSLGMKNPDLRLGIQGFIAKEDHSDYVETWAVRNGFIWRIPRGRETEYGVMAGFREAKGVFDGFLAEKNVKIEALVSGSVPQGLIIPENDSITLCGDAAGLTKPWSGGGVIWGLIAADILVDSFPDFKKYRQQVKRYFGLKIFILKKLTNIIYFLGFKMPWMLPSKIIIESDAIFSGLIRSTRRN